MPVPAAPRRLGRLMRLGVTQSLDHPHDRSPPGGESVGDLVHELAHEEDPAPAGLQEVFGRQRVREVVGIEAIAVIADPETL